MVISVNSVPKLLDRFVEYTKDPTAFLSNQPDIEPKVKDLVKECYDNAKKLEPKYSKCSFTTPKMFIRNFDAEQIWQQIELQNKFVLPELDEVLKNFVSISQQPIDECTEAAETDVSSSSIDSSEDEIEEEKPTKKVRFALSSEDDDDDDEEEVNDNLSEDEADNDSSKNSDTEDESNVEDNRLENEKIEISRKDSSKNDDTEIKSSFEERQQRLQQRVEKLEEDLLSEKPWQLKGEITAKKRPQNSLLEEVLEFDLSARPAPIITEEAAVKLEDVIKNRIINKVWDDVERKIKPVDTPREFKKKLVLDQEKSKLSLAEVYEQDYLNQRESVNREKKNEIEEEPKAHKQLRISLHTLFRKLDALSNYHYTPLPSIPEPQIVTNLPAVSLEEAIPDVTSNATLLAPEEIQGKVKGDLVGKEERTATDKKRARRKKKMKQKLKQKEIKTKEKILDKFKPVSGHKFAKEKIKKDLEKLMKDKSVSHFQKDPSSAKNSKSSKQFFEHLQDTVTGDNKTKKRKRETAYVDPKRIKL